MRSIRFCLVLIGLLFPFADVHAQSASGMMRYADISREHVVFVYGEDLWLVSREGGQAIPLASPAGEELMPRFSPDGKKIAFVGNYDGNQDLYTLPTSGGPAHRVTYHPGQEVLCDWTPDGKLLFSSDQEAGLPGQRQLYVQGEDEPLPQRLPVPYGTNGALHASGTKLAYTPHSHDFRTWKRYRGGMASDIWMFDLVAKKSQQLTQFEGTDSLPMWQGETVFYLSDGGNEHRLNIWSLDTRTGERQQRTRFKDHDCKWPSIGPGPNGQGEIVFQNGSELHVLSIESGQSRQLTIQVPGDRPKIRPRQVDASKWIEYWNISPTAKRALVEARGDIWTVPAKHGSPRNLTRSNGVAERSPAWSPDGKWITYLSDASGEYELMLQAAEGYAPPKTLTQNGKAYRHNLTWSPDSKWIYFCDKSGSMYLYSLDSGETKLFDQDPTATPLTVDWSHNAEWLTYAKAEDNRSGHNAIWVYNVRNGSKLKLTSGFFNDRSPVFDRKGEYLYFSSHRAFQKPLYEDIGTSFVYSGTEVLLAMPLRADVKNPLLAKSDEEKGEETNKPKPDAKSKAMSSDNESAKESADSPSDGMASQEDDDEEDEGDDDDEEEDDDEDDDDGVEVASGEREEVGAKEETTEETTAPAMASGKSEKAKTEEGKEAEKWSPFEIESKGSESRLFRLPVAGGRFGEVGVTSTGKLIYGRIAVVGEQDEEEGDSDSAGAKSLHLLDLASEKREEELVIEGASEFALTANRKKLLIVADGSAYILDAAADQERKDPLSVEGMMVTVDPKQEWKQVFHEAWRIERDFFYDPNMHGIDWLATKKHYESLLDHCVSRRDVGFLICEMISELNVGHAYYSAGDGEQGEATPMGLLGCRLELHEGAYRIAEIYRGAAWDTDARNSLDQANIQVGEYLLAINQEPLDTRTSPYAMLQGRAGKVVVVTVSRDPVLDSDDRQVPIELLASDQELRFRGWIESKRAMVDRATDGRVGYIYVTNTGVNGQNDLVRQFYGQRHKEALIIDDRWNGGGQIPTRFIELLNRPATNFWAVRDGRDWMWPPDSHQGPKCMLINGMAGSGGDMFPALFKQAGLGKLIGMRTWGGLVGISGNPGMIDGSSVTAPTFAYYEMDGTWGIEGHGVDPDIQIIDDPALMQDHGDPQLKAAIEWSLEELKTKGFKPPKRPAYPNRSGFGIAPEDR